MIDKETNEGSVSSPDLSVQRISLHKDSRSNLPRQKKARIRRRKKEHSPAKLVAMISAVLAALIVVKILIFPEDNGAPVITQLKSQNQSENLNQKPNTLILQPSHFAPHLLFAAGQNDFPTRMDIDIQGHEFPLSLEYTLNDGLQIALSDWLDRYDPDFAVAVAIDPDTGRILALTTHVSDGEPLGNLAMSSAFPAASVFKIITASAAMDLGKLNPKSIVPFNGKSTSLYKQNVFHHKKTKWTRNPTLAEAFAKSINTVFGRIGLYTVGPEQLNDYAQRFYFNHQISTDIPINPSETYIPLQGDDWAVVEAASGYTNKVTLSPLHGAALAASMVNGGVLMKPYLVENAYDEKGRLVYEGKSEQLTTAVSPQTAEYMQKLMAKTVSIGTARRSFRDFFKGQYADVKVGGKTGTLTGGDLKGLNDWFVGYAHDDQKKLAFAVLNINLDKWKVKSHYLARLMVEYYFDSTANVEMTASHLK